MKQHFLKRTLCYDGSQLRSHWIFEQTDEAGDAILSFIGPADVPTTNMVDLIDVRNNAPIASRSMLHFLIEHFETDLEKTILRQRLLVASALELLCTHISVMRLSALVSRAPAKNLAGADEAHHSGADISWLQLKRIGNDLYDCDRKLSVGIAAPSTVSCCIHFGINIDSEGTPVPTRGLADYHIDPQPFADELMKRYVEEEASLKIARCKVRAIE